MTLWLQAALAGKCQTDRTDRTDETTLAGELPKRPEPVNEVLSVLSVRQFEEGPAPVLTQPAARAPSRQAQPSQSRPEPFPYGTSPGGRPLTWTGRVVSLDAWRSLTDWERHGPRDALWNGLSQGWEPQDGGSHAV